jgi:hypothetical protein
VLITSATMGATRKYWILAAVASVAVSAVGCSKKAPQPEVRAAAPKAVEAPTPLAAQQDPNDVKHGSRRLAGIDVPVYVDNAQRAVLRYGELPVLPNLRNEYAPSFRLTDYLRGVGVAPESVKAIYVFDNANHIGSLEGKELVSDPDRFTFSFQGGTDGNALTEWDTTGLKNLYSPHEIRRLAIYVSKPAPAMDARHHCVLGTNGDCLEDGVPGASDPLKGTRVYVDGRMVGVVKRRQLADSTIVGHTADGDYEFSLARLVAMFGGTLENAKSVQFVSGDDVVGSADAAEWAANGNDVHFTLGKHQHGKVRVLVPADMQAKGEGQAAQKDALVTSVQVFVHAQVPQREVIAISESTDLSAQLASASSTGGGGEGRGEGAAEEDLGKR